MDFCLMTSTSSIILLPETRSSTYMSSEIASVRVGYSLMQYWKCSFNVPSSMNGDWMRPNTRRVNLFISITLGSEFFTQWNLNTSLSDSRILICRKAFSISPHNRMGLKRDLMRISHSEFYNEGPVFRHSFKDTESLFGLAKAS